MICILSLILLINFNKMVMTCIIIIMFKIRLLVLESLHNSMINQLNNNRIHPNPHKKYTFIISLILSHNRHLNLLLQQSLIKNYYTVLLIQIIHHLLLQFLEPHPKLITNSIKDSLPHQKRVNCKATFYLIQKLLILARFLFTKLRQELEEVEEEEVQQVLV